MARIVKKPEVRKEELLQIGISLFLQGGDRNVSIQKVIRQASVAVGAFYHYFVSKDDFLEQAHERYLHDYVGALEKIICDREVPVTERLDLLLEQFSTRFSEVISMYADEPPNAPNHFTLLQGLIVNKLHRHMTDFVAEGCDAGSFRSANPSLTALFIVCGLVGILQRINYVEKANAQAEIRRMVLSALAYSQEKEL